jgi:hypothetical protein
MTKIVRFEITNDKRRKTFAVSDINWSTFSHEEMLSQWGHCMNAFWHYEKEGVISKDDLKPYVDQYLKNNNYSSDDKTRFFSAPEWRRSATLYSSIYLSLQVKNETAENWIKIKVKEAIDAGEIKQEVKIEKQEEKPKPSIQEIMKEHLSDIIGEINGMEDEMLEKSPDFLSWFRQKNIAKIHLDSIELYFRKHAQEIYDYAEGKDEQLKEAYSYLNKSKLKKTVAWYETLFRDIDLYRKVKIANRKVRARKPKSPTKLVAKLKHLRYSEDYKLTSINAEKIIGAQTLYVFNVKTRKLFIYNASPLDRELTVKGSSILGFDIKESYGKTLRKPEEQLKELMDSGKVQNRKLIAAIKAKQTVPNGRINKDCLLLKVF